MQITTGDLDVAIIGQFPSTQLPLGDYLKAGALEMERLDAPLRRRPLIEEALENAARNPHRALIGTEDDREFEGIAVVIPACILWELEEQHCLTSLRKGAVVCSHYVLSG